MKKYLSLVLLFSITIFTYGQYSNSTLKDIKKQNRIKAHNFIKSELGERIFFNNFVFFQTDILTKDGLTCYDLNNNSEPYKAIVKYNLSIPAFSFYTEISVVCNINNDSIYFQNPERIPPFILDSSCTRFIQFKDLLSIVESKNGKIKDWSNISWKSNYNYTYKKFVYDIKIRTKQSKLFKYRKYNLFIIDAYTGEIISQKLNVKRKYFKKKFENKRQWVEVIIESNESGIVYNYIYGM